MRLRARDALTCLSVFATVLLAANSIALGRQGPLHWQLASDFRTAPHQANPNPDRYGHQDVWEFMEGSVLHSPSSYSLLPQFIPNTFDVRGLEEWQGDFISSGPLGRLPAVGINATGADQFPLTVSWPANVIRVHPLASDAVIVGWRSPESGNLRVEVGLSDLDPNGGDGIGWFVDAGGATLSSGELPNGGSDAVSLIVHVRKGTTLYFIVTDGGRGDYRFDSTGLSVNIHRGLGV